MTPAQNQKYADAIATELRALPGVTAATVTYVPSDLSSSAGVRAFIRSSTAGSETHLMDEFTRRLWTSRINPLSGLSVDVVAAGGGQNGRDITLDEIAPAMTAKYGPRPVPLLDR